MAKMTKQAKMTEQAKAARAAGLEMGRILRSFSPKVKAGGYVKVYTRLLANGTRRVKLFGAMYDDALLSKAQYRKMAQKLRAAGFVVHSAKQTPSGRSYAVVVDNYIPAAVSEKLSRNMRAIARRRHGVYFT